MAKISEFASGLELRKQVQSFSLSSESIEILDNIVDHLNDASARKVNRSSVVDLMIRRYGAIVLASIEEENSAD